MAEEVKLFCAKGSPFPCRVEIVLKLKGIDFEYLVQDLQNKSDQLLKYNPIHKKVPVLLHNEKPISESLVIVEYIDKAWKGFPILPSDPYQRTEARFWSKFIDNKFSAPLPCGKLLGQCKKRRRRRLLKGHWRFCSLENELKSKFFGGETLGLVDIVADFIAYWLPTVQEVMGLQLLTADKLPKLYEWSQEFVNHPVVKDSLPPKDKLIALFKARHASIIASI